MQFTYTTPLCKNDSSTLMWYFLINVPLEVAEQLNKPNRRVICTLNETEKINVALTPDGTGNYYIVINKDIRKKLGIEVGDVLTVVLEKDTSKYGIKVPPVFNAMIEQDPEGSELFHQLTPGKQRSLLHLMGKPKSENKQLEKAFVIFDYLKAVNGKLDFKELNEAFKNSRFKR